MVKLANLKKPELQQLAQSGGFKFTASAKKDDLVEIIEDGMRANPFLASNPAFAEYFDTRASPAKRTISKPALELPEEEKTAPPPRRRKTITKSEDTGESSSSLVPRTPASLQRLASRVQLPTSPALTRAWTNNSTYVSNQYKSLVRKSGIKKALPIARQDFSTVEAIHLLILIFEAVGLRRFTMPFVTTETPRLDYLKVNARSIPVPLITNILTRNFWAPTTLWLLTSVIVPAAFSYVFNLTYSNPRPRKARTTPKREFDPLVFSIVKALTAYAVYAPGNSFRFFGMFDAPTVEIVNNFVYGGYHTMLIGALVGVLTSYADFLGYKS